MPFARGPTGEQVHYTVTRSTEPPPDLREAPRILFVPSMASFATMWEAQQKFFSSSCDVAVVDNRGIAQSAAPSGIWRIEDMADDVICVLDALGWDTCHLVGHSLGQIVVNAAASRAPGRVRSLTWVSPVSLAPLGGVATDCCAPLGIWKLSGLCKELDLLVACDPKDRIEASLAINWPATYLARTAYDGGRGTNRDAVLRSMMDATRGQGRVPESTLFKQALAWVLHRPPSCRLPTLIIVGEEDALVYAQRLRSKVTAAQERGHAVDFLAVAGPGHNCQTQCAIAVNSAMEAFIVRRHQDDVDEVSETTRLSGTMMER